MKLTPAIALFAVTVLLRAADEPVTWTGWFSEERCARSRVASGNLGPNNPDCNKTCIEKGAAPVFLSEQARAMFRIKGYSSVVDDLGWHIELYGKLDRAAGTITIEKVTRLSYQGAACARPKKK